MTEESIYGKYDGAIQDLKEHIKRNDKSAQQQAIDKLLDLSGFGSKSKAHPSNALEREMLKGAQQ